MNRIMEKIQTAITRNIQEKRVGNTNATKNLFNRRMEKPVNGDNVYVDILYKKKDYADNGKNESVTYGLLAVGQSTSGSEDTEPITWVSQMRDRRAEKQPSSSTLWTDCDSSECSTIKGICGSASMKSDNVISKSSSSCDTHMSGDLDSTTNAQDQFTTSESDTVDSKLPEDIRKLTLCKVFVEQKLNAFMENRKQILRCKEVIRNKAKDSEPTWSGNGKQCDRSKNMGFGKGDFYLNNRNLVVDIKNNYNEETGETTREEVRKVIVVCSELSCDAPTKSVGNTVTKNSIRSCRINRALQIDSNDRPGFESESKFNPYINVTTRNPANFSKRGPDKYAQKFRVSIKGISRDPKSEENIIRNLHTVETNPTGSNTKELTPCSLTKFSALCDPGDRERVEVGWRNSAYVLRHNSSVFDSVLDECNSKTSCSANCNSTVPFTISSQLSDEDYPIIEVDPHKTAKCSREDCRRTQAESTNRTLWSNSVENKLIYGKNTTSSGSKMTNAISTKIKKPILTDTSREGTRHNSRLCDFTKVQDSRGCGEVFKMRTNRGLYGCEYLNDAQNKTALRDVTCKQSKQDAYNYHDDRRTTGINHTFTVNIATVKHNVELKERKLFENRAHLKLHADMKALDKTGMLTTSLKTSARTQKETLSVDMSNGRNSNRANAFSNTDKDKLRPKSDQIHPPSQDHKATKYTAITRTVKPKHCSDIKNMRRTDPVTLHEIETTIEQRMCTSNNITQQDLNTVITPRAVTNYVISEKEPSKRCEDFKYLTKVNSRKKKELKEYDTRTVSGAIIVRENRNMFEYSPTSNNRKLKEFKRFSKQYNCLETNIKEDMDYLERRRNMDSALIVDSNRYKDPRKGILTCEARMYSPLPESDGIRNKSNINGCGFKGSSMKHQTYERLVVEGGSVNVQKGNNGEILSIGTSQGFNGFVHNSYVETRNGIWQERLEIKNVCVMKPSFLNSFKMNDKEFKDVLEVDRQRRENHSDRAAPKDEGNVETDIKTIVKTKPNVYIEYEKQEQHNCLSDVVKVTDVPKFSSNEAELTTTNDDHHPTQTIFRMTAKLNAIPKIAGKQSRLADTNTFKLISTASELLENCKSDTARDNPTARLEDHQLQTFVDTDRSTRMPEMLLEGNTENDADTKCSTIPKTNGTSDNYVSSRLIADIMPEELKIPPQTSGDTLLTENQMCCCNVLPQPTTKLLEELNPIVNVNDEINNQSQSQSTAFDLRQCKHKGNSFVCMKKQTKSAHVSVVRTNKINSKIYTNSINKLDLVDQNENNPLKGVNMSKSIKKCGKILKVCQRTKRGKLSPRPVPCYNQSCLQTENATEELESGENSVNGVGQDKLSEKTKKKINFKKKYTLLKKNPLAKKPQPKRSWKYLYLGKASAQEHGGPKENLNDDMSSANNHVVKLPKEVTKENNVKGNGSTTLALQNNNVKSNPAIDKMLIRNFETICRHVDERLLVCMANLRRASPQVDFQDLLDKRFRYLNLKELDMSIAVTASGIKEYPFHTDRPVNEINSILNLDNGILCDNKLKVQGELCENTDDKAEQNQLYCRERDNKWEENENTDEQLLKTAKRFDNSAASGEETSVKTGNEDAESTSVRDQQTQCHNATNARRIRPFDILFYREGGRFDKDEISMIATHDWGETFSRCSVAWKVGSVIKETKGLDQNPDGLENKGSNNAENQISVVRSNHKKDSHIQITLRNFKAAEHESTITNLNTIPWERGMEMKNDRSVEIPTEATNIKSACTAVDAANSLQVCTLCESKASNTNPEITIENDKFNTNIGQNLVTHESDCTAADTVKGSSDTGQLKLETRKISKRTVSVNPKTKRRKGRFHFAKRSHTKYMPSVAGLAQDINNPIHNSKSILKINVVDNSINANAGNGGSCKLKPSLSGSHRINDHVSCLWQNKSVKDVDEDSEYWDDFLSTMHCAKGTESSYKDCSQWDPVSFADINNTRQLTMQILKGLGRNCSATKKDDDVSDYKSASEARPFFSAVTSQDTALWNSALDAWSSEDVLSYEDALLSLNMDIDNREQFVSCTDLNADLMTYESAVCQYSDLTAFHNDTEETSEAFQDAISFVP